MSPADVPEGMVQATYTGAAPRHFPGLRLTVAPGESHLIPEDVAREMADVFRVAMTAAPAPDPQPITTDGEE